MKSKTFTNRTLSPQQRRVHYLHENDAVMRGYSEMQIRGLLNLDRLVSGIQTVVSRHTIFNDASLLANKRSTDHAGQDRSFLDVWHLNESLIHTVYGWPSKDHPITVYQKTFYLFEFRVNKFSDELFSVSIESAGAVADSTSLFAILKEICMVYSSENHAGESGDHISYSQFTDWQNELLGAVDEDAVLFWDNYDFNNYKYFRLPFEKEQNASTSYRPLTIGISVRADRKDAIASIAKDLVVGTPSVLMAELMALLFKYSGHKNMVFGNVFNSRQFKELTSVIGPIAKTLPVSVHIDTEGSLRDLILQVDKVVADVSLWQDSYFFGLDDKNEKEPDYFPVGFEYVDLTEKLQGPDHAEFSVVHLFNHSDKFKLKLCCLDYGDFLQLNFSYDPHYFDAAIIEIIALHFEELLARFPAAIDDRIDELSFLTARDNSNIVQNFSKQVPLHDGKRTIIDFFEEQATKNPDAKAVILKGSFVSYRQLDEAANKLANYLVRNQYARPDAIIALLTSQSEWMVIGILGILKAGAAYLPLDPAFPGGRIKYMLADSGANILLTETDLLFKINSDYQGEIFALDIQLDGLESVDKPFRGDNVNDLGYIIYTSGSTGHPKGVMIENSSLINYLLWANDYYFNGESERIIFGVFTPLVFDLTLTSLFIPLLRGDSLFLCPGQDIHQSLLNMLDENSPVNTVKLTPSHIRALKHTTLRQMRVKHVIVGGEALKKEDIALLVQLNPAVKIYNEYGPTEATIGCVVQEATNGILTIGRPIANTHICIVNKNQHVVPIGFDGEIYIGGSGLARGYLNQPELTNGRFINNPFGQEGRLYKTGDRGRWLPDGTIEYLGREDEQVKIRGYRIELGEIEKVLEQIGAGCQAIVSVWGDGDDRKLIAYLLAEKGLKPGDLRKQLSEYLPEYMIPVQFIMLESFPLTTNGKLDKKLLPIPENKSHELYVPASSKMEQQLVEAFESVLGRKEIGVKDNFFALGGDSIKAIQVASRMHNAGYKLEVRNILQEPVIEKLALLIEAPEQISQDSVSGEFILSPIQHYFFEQHSPVSHYYNQTMFLKGETLSKTKVAAVFHKLLEHHDALRMIYHVSSARVTQINQPFVENVFLEEFDFNDHSFDEAIAAIAHQCEKLQGSFSLETGPLMKAALFHLSDADRLFIVVHHLVIDGVSWRILLEDIDTLLKQYNQNMPLALPSKTNSYQQWCNKLSLWCNTKEFDLQEAYWIAQNRQMDKIHGLIPDFEGTQNYIKDSVSKSFVLTPLETELLLTKPHHAYQAEINDILLTALAITYQKVYRHDRLLVGLEGHGREEIFPDIDITRTVGWFTSMYPVVLEVDEGEPYWHQLIRIKEQLRNVPLKGIGYGVLRYLKRKDETWNLKPQISFNYLGQFNSDLAQSGLHTTTGPTGSGISDEWERDAAWDIVGIIIGKTLQVSLTYNSNQYAESRIDGFLKKFQEVLVTLINHCAEAHGRILTPSDVTGKNISIEQLLKFQKEYAIEDVYELSPLQEGLLFHSFSNQAEVYFEQISYRMNANLRVDLVKQSLQHIVQRHPVLRTVFIYRDQETPLQLVLKDRQADFTFIDLRSLSGAEQEGRIEHHRMEDRKQGFDVSNDVLMRILLLQTGDLEYELIWSHHHIVMDGWCNSILIGEFWTIYESLFSSDATGLQPVKPYRDYIRWLQKNSGTESLTYWSSYLQNYNQAAGFPRKSSRQGSFIQQTSFVNLGQERTKKLTNFCGELQITINTAIQSLWGILLSRYANSRDVVFGSIVSGRPADLRGVEEMIGLFINTIPVRLKYDKHTVVNDLLIRVQREAIDSQPYHYSQLAQIQANSEVGMNLLDHILIFENYPLESKVSDLTTQNDNVVFGISGVQIHEQTNYGLTIVVIPGKDLVLKMVFNSNVYEEWLIEQLGLQFIKVVDQVISNQYAPVDGLGLLDTNEQERLLKKLPAESELYTERSILELIERSVSERYDAVSVVYDDRVLTYGQLHAMSNQLAQYLQEEWTVKGKIVGLFTRRSERMLVGMLGILKGGAAYLPLDPDLPMERLKYMLEDANVALVLSDELQVFPETLPVVKLESIRFDQYLPNAIQNTVSANDLAYVMYTSGSTGWPKGVMIEHNNLVNFMYSMSAFIGLENNDRLLAVTTYSFDISILELLWPLTKGASVTIAGKEQVRDLLALKDLIGQSKPSIMQATPSLWQGLLLTGWAGNKSFRALCGGEALSKELSEELQNLSGELWNLYGPTETTIWSTVKAIRNSRNPTIGHPIANTDIHILNEDNELIPIGVEGDIYIGGAGLARGYLNKPELTAEKFVDHPFRPGERLYQTGDRGRWSEPENPEIEYLGRKDDQVKIRGHRIELGEIEHAIEQLFAVTQSVVVAHEFAGGDQSLVAYLCGADGADHDRMRKQLLTRLPEYMVPSYFMVVDSFPLTANGKLNRKALPKPETQVMDGHEKPHNEVEWILVDIWEKVLGRHTVGITENFFLIGGHSLKAMQVIIQVSKRIGVTLDIKNIFENPSIAMLAKIVVSSQKEEYKAIHRVTVQSDYALSHAQKRLWIEQQLHPGETTYNLSGAFKLRGYLQIESLQSAFKTLVQRHESLRTTYRKIDGEPRQIIHHEGNCGFSLVYADLTMDENAEENVAIAVKEQAQTVFSLQDGPLLKATLWRISSSEFVFALTMHHIISDAWSMKVLVNEVLSLYEANCLGKENPLPPLTIQYKDYAHWQLRRLEGQKLEYHKRYWHEKLSGEIPVLSFPADYTRPAIKTYGGDSISVVIPRESVKELQKLNQQRGTTMFMGLVAIVKMLLFKYTGQEDIIVGTPVAGRDHADIENQIGFYINTLPLRTQFSGSKSFDELMHQVRETTLGAYAHQVYPYHLLVDELHHTRDISRSPLFDVVVVFQNAGTETAGPKTLYGIDVDPYDHKITPSMVDLRLEFTEVGKGIYFQLDYNTDLFSRRKMENFQQHFLMLVNEILTNSSRPLISIPYLAPEERKILTESFNLTKTAYDQEQTLVTIFESCVEHHPDAVAVIHNDTALTYGQLDQRAKLLAHFLQENNIHAGKIVGLALDRNDFLIIAMLGILKSGAAYLPLDPSYPAERLRYMATDSNVSLIITETALMFNLDWYTGDLFVVDIQLDSLQCSPVIVLAKPLNHDIAYVIYTSGSTGHPKGVMIEHAGIVNTILGQADEFEINQTDSILQFASVSFDASISEIGMCWVRGATLVLIDKYKISQPDLFISYLQHHWVNIVTLPPAYLRQLDKQKLNFLDTIITAGEAARTADALACIGFSRYYNAYGPTETSVCATSYRVTASDENGEVIPIGRPIANTQVYVLDSHLQLMPVGVEGDIYVGGTGLARGYVNQPELTAQRFMDNPFISGKKMYKTGDRGKWLWDGALEYLGRDDEQVKIRGYRIELQEITHALEQIAFVKQAVVIVKEDKHGDKQLIAYFLPEAPVETSFIRESLIKCLPEYMIPAHFVNVDAFSLTVNGKINRDLLPLPEQEIKDSYTKPHNELEAELVKIWELVLDRHPISVTDNFFNIGGDSIKIIRLHEIIKTCSFGKSLNITNLFSYPTVAGLAEFIMQTNRYDAGIIEFD